MNTRVQFWRDVNSDGHAERSIIKTYIIPSGIDDLDAIGAAMREFCQELDVVTWTEAAHGYDVSCRTDEMRRTHQRDSGSAYWERRIEAGQSRH
ncbi:hypothetical protein JCM17960_23060 [Magnetospira thiophila]